MKGRRGKAAGCRHPRAHLPSAGGAEPLPVRLSAEPGDRSHPRPAPSVPPRSSPLWQSSPKRRQGVRQAPPASPGSWSGSSAARLLCFPGYKLWGAQRAPQRRQMMTAPSGERSSSARLCLALGALGLALLGNVSRAVPMDDQDYYLQEISNRDHYYSFPYPGEEFFPFTEQPGGEGPIRAAETEEHPGFKPSRKELKPKKSNKKGKSVLETAPGNFPPPPAGPGARSVPCRRCRLALASGS